MTGPDSPSSAAEKACEEFARPFVEELARLRRQDSLQSRLASTATFEDARRQSLDYSPTECASLPQRPPTVSWSKPVRLSGGERAAFPAGVPPASAAEDSVAAGAWLVATGPVYELGKTHGCQSPPNQQPWQASSPIQQPWQASSPTAAEAVTSVRERASLPTQPPCAAADAEAPLGLETLDDVIAASDDSVIYASSCRGSEASTSWAAAGTARAPERDRGGRRPRSSGGGGGGAASRLRVSLHELEREYDELLERKCMLEREISELEGRTEVRREPAGPQQQQLEPWVVADSPPSAACCSADALPPEQEPTADDPLQAAAMDCVNWDVLSP